RYPGRRFVAAEGSLATLRTGEGFTHVPGHPRVQWWRFTSGEDPMSGGALQFPPPDWQPDLQAAIPGAEQAKGDPDLERIPAGLYLGAAATLAPAPQAAQQQQQQPFETGQRQQQPDDAQVWEAGRRRLLGLDDGDPLTVGVAADTLAAGHRLVIGRFLTRWQE